MGIFSIHKTHKTLVYFKSSILNTQNNTWALSYSGLLYWGKASYGTYSDLNDTITPVTTDGSSVGTLLDLSQNSYTFWCGLNSVRPTLKTNRINGYPSLLFNGSSQFLKRDFNDIPMRTIIAVVKDTSSTGDRAIAGCESNNALGAEDAYYFLSRWGDRTNASMIFVGDNGSIQTYGRALIPAVANTWYIQVGRLSGSTIDVWSNSTLGTSASLAGTPVAITHPSTIGCCMYNDNQTSYFQGEIAEILMWNTALSNTNISNIVTGLRQQYAI